GEINQYDRLCFRAVKSSGIRHQCSPGSVDLGFVRMAVKEKIEIAGRLQSLSLTADVAVHPRQSLPVNVQLADFVMPDAADVGNGRFQFCRRYVPIAEYKMTWDWTEQAYGRWRINIATVQDQFSPAFT